MKKSKRVLFIFFALLMMVTLVLFQNCSDVRLADTRKLQLVTKTMRGEFCTSDVVYFFAYNLTSKLHPQNLVPEADSDMDGFSDREEGLRSYSFDIFKRRTYGRLDGLCEDLTQAQCQRTPVPTVIGPGFIESDLSDFTVSHLQGVDSDGDRIPDILEFLSRSDLAIADDVSDLDTDGIANSKEIASGLNARNNLDKTTSYPNRTTVQTAQTDTSCGTGQKLYSFSIDNIPLVNTLAFTPDIAAEDYLKHDAGENLILVTYTSSNGQGTKIYGAYLKVNIKNPGGDVFIKASDFSLLGAY